MTTLPSTAAECLELAGRLAGNPFNAQEIADLQARALLLMGRAGAPLSETARGLIERAQADRAALDAAWAASRRFNRSAARRAARARKAA